MNIIEQLKQNEKPFGLMSREMQDKAEEIGKEHFVWWQDTRWRGTAPTFSFSNNVYRLKSSYTEKPKVIELEIYKSGRGLWIQSNDRPHLYTNAPALCPEPGYYFAGFKYSDGIVARNTTRWVAPNGCVMYCHTQDLSSWTIDRPVAALFERGE